MMKKRVLSLFLAMTFTLGLLSGAALASEEAAEETPAAEIVEDTMDNGGIDATADPQGADATSAGVATVAELKAALAAAAEGTEKTVTLTGDVTISANDLSGLSTTNAVISIPSGVTLNGGNHSISATGLSGSTTCHILSVEGAADETTLQNLTIEGCKNTKSGIHVYQSANVKLENVTIKSCGNAAMLVNGSVVTATSLTTEGNSWGAINVDQGTGVTANASFTLVSGTLHETAKIWTEKEELPITVPAGWASAKRDDNMTHYAPLADTITAAADGATVTLQQDVTESMTIPANKTITLDLNGKTLSLPNGQAIKNEGTLTIKDSTGNGKIVGSSSYYTIENKGTLTIGENNGANNFTISSASTDSSMIENGWYNNDSNGKTATLTVYGGTLTGGLNTIKNDDGGVLNIQDGKISNTTQYAVMNWNKAMITGGEIACSFTKTDRKGNTVADGTAVYNEKGSAATSAGEMTITGGKMTGGSTGVDSTGDGAKLTITGGEFVGTRYYGVSVSKGTDSGGPVEISGGTLTGGSNALKINAYVTGKITGGTFNGSKSVSVNKTATLQITGGTYFSDVSAYCAEGYEATLSDGKWTVAEAAPTTYTVTIAEGIEHGTVEADKTTAAEGDTVTLTVTPASGYELDTLTVTYIPAQDDATAETGETGTTTGPETPAEPQPVEVTVTNNSFTMPAADVTVTATFKAKTVAPSEPSTPSRPTTTTTTEKNEDGSTTTTKTNRVTGTVTETTTYPDGSSTTVETKKDGTVTTTGKAADGSTTKTVTNPDGSSQMEVKQADGTTASIATDAEGNTQTQVTVSQEAVETAAQENKPVSLPIPAVEPAQTVEVDVPETAGDVKVEIPVEEVTPGTVAVIVNEKGEEEIVKTSIPTDAGVALTLNGSATVKIVDNARDFPDVHEDHWAKDSVAFVSARRLFQGDEFGNFDPDGTMTRGMVAAVLHNFENNPDFTFEGSFTDVAEDAWYTAAVEWAASQRIVSGYGDGLYGAEDDITREQFVTILYRYTALRDLAIEGRADLSTFADADTVSDFADEAMRWAVGVGLIQGDDNGALLPQNSATRAQVAAILERFLKLI